MRAIFRLLSIVLIQMPCLLLSQPLPSFKDLGEKAGDDPIGGTVQLGGGLLILLGLAIGYGIRKYIKARDKLLD